MLVYPLMNVTKYASAKIVHFHLTFTFDVADADVDAEIDTNKCYLREPLKIDSQS